MAVIPRAAHLALVPHSSLPIPEYRRTYWVYLLIDPRDGCVFYVGFTGGGQAHFRGRHHEKDRNSAAYPRICEIRAAGRRLKIKVAFRSHERHEALREETRLIQTLPGLVNIQHNRRRR